MPLYSHYPHAEIAAGRHDVPPSAPDAERFVRKADIGDGWLHPYASNYTFVVRLSLDEQEGCGVYKPQTGERPLWDFPTGTLAHRECATYELSRALGWGLVPPTVLREGEADEGSLQLFVPHDPDSNFFTLRDEHPEEAFRLAVLDLLANNADRKGGHCFVGLDGRVWAVDNGLTFHEEWKLRTVIWDYSDEPVPDALVADIARVAADLDSGGACTETLAALLDEAGSGGASRADAARPGGAGHAVAPPPPRSPVAMVVGEDEGWTPPRVSRAVSGGEQSHGGNGKRRDKSKTPKTAPHQPRLHLCDTRLHLREVRLQAGDPLCNMDLQAGDAAGKFNMLAGILLLEGVELLAEV